MQAERPTLGPPAPAMAPASLPSPAARSRSLCPGLYLQTLHSSHGRCQLLRPPRRSCPCSPLAHCSFTASASCHHPHTPLSSSRFLPGHVQAGAAMATAIDCSQTQEASPASPSPGTCPLHQHQQTGQLPKKHSRQSTATAKGPLGSSREVSRQCCQPSGKSYALGPKS